jgi:hypothetical protein
LVIFHPRAWYKRRKQRKKEEMERALKQKSLRVLTFIVTFIGMILGLSLIPIFPQPLPLLISFLIAFAAFMNHARSGMTMGCLAIGLAVVYHMSGMNILSQISPMYEVRLIAIIVIPAVCVILPNIFHHYEDAIAINLGIISATLLFFKETYYFAIPLILVVAALYKKTKLGLTISYYVLVSLPLQIMQYLNYVLSLNNPSWWEDPAVDPVLYAPLTGILKGIQESMSQFRILEANKILATISGQFYFSDSLWISHGGSSHILATTQAVLARYFDSLPGMVLFLVIVIGLVSATALLTRELVATSKTMHAKVILPALTSSSATGLFFLFLIGLQGPLAFKTQINMVQILIGISTTTLVAVVASLVNYAPKTSLQIEKLSKLIIEKAQELLRVRLQVIEWSLNKVKSSIPLDVSAIEGRMLMKKAQLENIISNVQTNLYNFSELKEKFDEVDKNMINEIDKLMSDLESKLAQYQIFVYSEYSSWVQKLEGIGLEVGTPVKTDFQKELPLELKLKLIRELLDSGRNINTRVLHVTKQTYDLIRTLYDPNLPEKNLAVTFARKKLDENIVSWTGLNALFTALHNWQRQYRSEISKSMDYLQTSLNSIVNVGAQSESLLSILGDNFPKLMDLVKKAEDIKTSMEKKALSIMNILILREVLESSLKIARDVLLIVQEELIRNEKAIGSMQLTKDYSWEKRIEWRKKIVSETDVIVNSSNYDLRKVIENLPRSLSYLDELVSSIVAYNEKREILTNYPIAKRAIEELLTQKKKVYAQDLPFDLKYAEEYLRLFYSQKYLEFYFDRENNFLIKKE